MDYTIRGYKTLDWNNVVTKTNTAQLTDQLQNPPKIITGTGAGGLGITPHNPRTTDHESGVIDQGARVATHSPRCRSLDWGDD